MNGQTTTSSSHSHLEGGADPKAGRHLKDTSTGKSLKEVETVGGKTGEFTVWVNDKLVARKGWIRFPGDQKVLEAVRAALNG
jgi:hypothetical protein